MIDRPPTTSAYLSLSAISYWSGIFGIAWAALFVCALFVDPDPTRSESVLGELAVFLSTASFFVAPRASQRPWRRVVRTAVVACLAFAVMFAVLAVVIDRVWTDVPVRWPLLSCLGATLSFALGLLTNPLGTKARYVLAVAVALIGGTYFAVREDWFDIPWYLGGYGIVHVVAIFFLAVSCITGFSARMMCAFLDRRPGHRWARNAVFVLATILSGLGAYGLWTSHRGFEEWKAFKMTHLWIGWDGIVLEFHRAHTGAYPLPGFAGSALVLGDALSSYGGAFRALDGWNRPLFYICDPDGLHYVLLSGGQNAAIDWRGSTDEPKVGSIESIDVVVSDGAWIEWCNDWGVLPEAKGMTTESLRETIELLMQDGS